MTPRVLPHNIDAEQGVLGSMMIGGPAVIEEMQAQLSQDAFYEPRHQILFGGMLGLQMSGIAVDLVTLTNALRDAGMLETMGGAAYVTEINNAVPSPANVSYYAAIVREKFLLRRMILVCAESSRRCYDEPEDPRKTLDQLQADVIELSQIADSKESIRHASEFVPEAKGQILAAYHGRGKVTGLPTGFSDLDRMTNGLDKGYVYVYGARPAMGKTSMALSLASHIAIANADNGNRVMIFSLEMTGVQLIRRLILSHANVSMQRMRDGFMKKEDLPRIEEASDRIIRSHVLVDDKPGLNLFELRARIRRAVVKYHAKVIMIDYLQMVHGVSKRAEQNRQAEISEVIQGIAETAKELQVPVIVLAQLSRKPEDRKWGIPEMSDLRESGDIENYAHLIALLWRPEYYAPTDKQKEQLASYLSSDRRTFDVEDLEGYAQAIIVKQREGPTGPAELYFEKEYARYENPRTASGEERPLYSNRTEDRQQHE